MENENHKIWQNNYESRGDKYSVMSGGNRWQRYLIESILRDIEKPSVKSVLDVGCGTGEKTSLLGNIFQNAAVTGVDFAGEGISIANRLYGTDRVHFECMDITDMVTQYAPDRKDYSLVSSFQVLEHIEDWENMLSTICDISERYVLISVPAGRMRKYEVFDGHFRNYKKGQIENFMIRKGYRVLKTYYAGFSFYSPLERDILLLTYHKHEGGTKNFQYSGKTKIMHDLIYFLYKNFNSKRVGDQFVGIFERKTV